MRETRGSKREAVCANLFTAGRKTDNNLSDHQTANIAPHNRLEHGTNRRGGESSARQQQEAVSANLFTAERMAHVSHFRSSDRRSRRLECCCSIDEGLREDAGTFPCPKRLYSARYEDVQPVKRK